MPARDHETPTAPSVSDKTDSELARIKTQIGAQQPLLTVVAPTGDEVKFFEHPLLGDEAPMIAVFPSGKVDISTDAWDSSTARLYVGLDG
jgi:hypothetical protein